MAFCSKIVYSEEELEEVVVKGSYLKRTAADSPSPCSVMTAGEIEDIGAADIAEIVQSIPWSSGSQKRTATFRIQEGYDHGYYFIVSFIRDHINFHSEHLK